MLEFKKTEVEAKIYGELYKLRRPTVKEAQEYARGAKGCEEEKQSELLIALLDMCGLPSEVALGMEAEHLIALVEGLMPSKKK